MGQETLNQCQMEGSHVVSWLAENYLDFMTSMASIRWSSDWISWSDAHLSGSINWRLGLTPAADWNDLSGNQKCSAARHYPAIVVSRSLLLAPGLAEDDAVKPLRKGLHPIRSPSAQNDWRIASDNFSTVADLLTDQATPIRDFWRHLLVRSRSELIQLLPFMMKCGGTGAGKLYRWRCVLLAGINQTTSHGCVVPNLLFDVVLPGCPNHGWS